MSMRSIISGGITAVFRAAQEEVFQTLLMQWTSSASAQGDLISAITQLRAKNKSQYDRGEKATKRFLCYDGQLDKLSGAHTLEVEDFPLQALHDVLHVVGSNSGDEEKATWVENTRNSIKKVQKMKKVIASALFIDGKVVKFQHNFPICILSASPPPCNKIFPCFSRF